MKRLHLILIALLVTGEAHAQWSISPKTITNSQSYTFTVNSLDRDKEYKWVMSVRGMANLTVRIHTVYNNIPSGYLRLDSIYIPSPGSAGLTMFTYGITGDSLMNLWLPDDSGSLGTPGLNLKKTGSWSATITVQTQISGNTGVITMANATISLFTPPPTSDDYAYTRWVAGVDYVTPQQLSDSADGLCRTCVGGTPVDTAHARDAMWTRVEQQDTTIAGQSRRREQQLSDSVRTSWAYAGAALSTALAAQGQADRATYMSEHDSTLTCTDDYNAGDLNTTHPRLYIFSVGDKGLTLANASAHPNGARYTVFNASDGNVFVRYQPGDDPDNSGNDIDTVAQQQWRMVVAADGLWKVITATPGPQGPQGATGPQGPQGVPGSTPLLAAYKDTASDRSSANVWTKQQNFRAGFAMRPPLFNAADTAVFYPWYVMPPKKATDAATEEHYPFGMTMRWATLYDGGVKINGTTNHHAFSYSLGVNPNGFLVDPTVDPGADTIPGFWDKWELYQDWNSYPWNIAGISGIFERHREARGVNKAVVRYETEYIRRSDARLRHKEFASDYFLFSNGAGVSPGSSDSIALGINPPVTNGTTRTPGTLEIYDSKIRSNVVNPQWGPLWFDQRPDSTAQGYYAHFGVEDYGGALQWYGASNGVACSALAYPAQTALRARQVQVWCDAVFSRITLDANEIRRTSSVFLRPGAFVDSLAVVTQAYVDSVVNGKIRLALSDTAAFFKRIELAFARSGGASRYQTLPWQFTDSLVTPSGDGYYSGGYWSYWKGPIMQLAGVNSGNLYLKCAWTQGTVRVNQDHGLYVGTTNAYELKFQTNNTARMRIDRNGKVRIGSDVDNDGAMGRSLFTVLGGADIDTGKIPQLQTQFIRYDSTGWSARDSVVWYKYEQWDPDEGPLPIGASNPLEKTATIKFRVKYAAQYATCKRWTLRADSANGCRIMNVGAWGSTYRLLPSYPYNQGGNTTTRVTVAANQGPSGVTFNGNVYGYMLPRGTGSLSYLPMWLGNNGGNNDLHEMDVEIQVTLPADKLSTWYVTPSIE